MFSCSGIFSTGLWLYLNVYILLIIIITEENEVQALWLQVEGKG